MAFFTSFKVALRFRFRFWRLFWAMGDDVAVKVEGMLLDTVRERSLSLHLRKQ